MIKIRTEVILGSIDVVLDVALHLALVVVFVAIAVGRAHTCILAPSSSTLLLHICTAGMITIQN